MGARKLLSSLVQLQREQLCHDQLAHPDILHLMPPAKLLHFTLHFAKYVGAIARAHRLNDSASERRALTDSFVIALASANALKANLQLCMSSIEIGTKEIGKVFVSRYVELVGVLAKANEARDHYEDHPSHQVSVRAVTDLVTLIIQYAELINFDLDAAVHVRWAEVEQQAAFLNTPNDNVSSSLSIVV
jgi:hypothetical protein